MAEPGLSELITTTLRLRHRELANNIENNNPLTIAMKDKGAIKKVSGGRTLLEEMAYAENASFIRYSGAQTLNTSYNPTITSAEFSWKQFAIAIVMNGLEERQNSGKERQMDLLESRLANAEFTLENKYHADMLSDGTADGGKQIGGLQALISKTPTTGTVGGIDRSATAGAFYRNFKFDTINDTTGGAPGGVATTEAVIKKYLNYCINKTTRGKDKVNLLLMGQSHFEALQGALQAIQTISSSKMADAGFQALNYMGIDCVMGGGVSFGGEDQVQTDLTYGINTRHLKMCVHKDANFSPLPEVQSIDQDAKVKLLIWMGNMTLSNAKAQFVMFDS